MKSTVYCNSIENIFWDTKPVAVLAVTEGIDVWRIAVSANAQQLSYFNALLQPDELNRADRYHQEKDRQRFVISRAILRILLGKYLGQEPAGIQLITGKNKKPFVQNAGAIDLHYNTSHSGDWILIAVGNSDIGVDVEKIDNTFSYEDVLHLGFGASEINLIKTSASPREYFYLHWTRKEALTKASGKGLDDGLISVPCLDGWHTVDAEIAGDTASWVVSSFKVGTQYIGSVAYDSNEKNIRFREIIV